MGGGAGRCEGHAAVTARFKHRQSGRAREGKGEADLADPAGYRRRPARTHSERSIVGCEHGSLEVLAKGIGQVGVLCAGDGGRRG